MNLLLQDNFIILLLDFIFVASKPNILLRGVRENALNGKHSKIQQVQVVVGSRGFIKQHGCK